MWIVFVEFLINYNIFHKSVCKRNNNMKNMENICDILQGEQVITCLLNNLITFF